MSIVYPWTRELELVLYGKLYITRIRASYTWQYVKRNILLRFYGISHACANSGAQAVFFPPPQKRPGNEANVHVAVHWPIITMEIVSPGDLLLLLLHHLCQLSEDGAQLHNGGVDVLHGIRSLLDVGILQAHGREGRGGRGGGGEREKHHTKDHSWNYAQTPIAWRQWYVD